MKTSVELREQRAALVADARKIIDVAKEEERDLSAEEEQAYDAKMADVDKMKVKIDRMERLELVEDDLEAPVTRAGRPIDTEERMRPEQKKQAEEKKLAAFRQWLRTGEVRPELRTEHSRISEFRDTIISTDAKGGFLITPVQISNDIVSLIMDQVFVRQLCDAAGSITTVTEAKKLGIRKRTAHMADADWTTEVQAVTEDTTQAFDRRDLEPQLCSKLSKVSIRTLMLSVDAEREVNGELAYKFGITEEKGFLTGSGTGQPLGLFTASASGIPTSRDVVAATATAFTADNLIDMKFSLKAAYQGDKATAWVMHRSAVKLARKLKIATTTGGNDLEYIWQPGITEGAPDRILAIPYYMSEYAPATFTTGLYVAVLGCFRFYRIAQLADVLIQRLVELYAATNEVGFIGRRWVDGSPVLDEAWARLKLA
jgi:HK97 family phage major capsid protein